MTLSQKLREDYRLLFGRQWPAWLGGLLIGVLNVFLFLFYQPWTTLDGVLNWGDWTLGGLGVINAQALSPLLRSGSVINFGLLFGALASALLAGQFGVRVGPGRELLKGLVGGLLLGAGAVIARGCNIGGFFSSTSAFAMNGLTMAVGLAGGAFLGARYLVWEVERAPAAAAPGATAAFGVWGQG
ncbi:MAG: YeeE/YedE family protein, partial [Chloroflexi bacterium]|nr:YeeE/YedE family protein [Chloroflexota bacterium]